METIVHYNNNSAIDYKVTHTSLATSSEKFPAWISSADFVST